MGFVIDPENPEYTHERLVSPAALRRRGLTKYRSKVTPTGHVLRFAFPPGPRRRGAGRLQAILHPKGERRNPDEDATMIYSRVLEIRASKAGMDHRCSDACRRAGHRYVHRFKTRASIWGLPDGSLVIESEE